MQSVSKLSLSRLKKALNKWRVAFLIFAVAYAAITFLTLTTTPIEWDEVAHLNGGSFLLWGEYQLFTRSAFYPPLLDCITFLSFKVFGVSLLAARLVPLAFSILSLWAVFELANTLYDGKAGLLSAVLLAIMPGFFWVSRLALLETMLIFFVTLALLFFYKWLLNRQDRWLVLTGIAVGLGFLTKYQMVVAFIIMLLSAIFLARKQLKLTLKKFSIAIGTAFLVTLPWIVIAYETYADLFISEWLYALQFGNPERTIYSDRYPAPIFYFIEMTWPYSDIHPISIFLYIAGLLGLGFLAWRRRRQDKYVLIWFVTIFIFFTIIANKQWRYVLTLFPALAISAAVLILHLFDRAKGSWKLSSSIKKKRTAKIAAGLLIVCVAGAILYSINDAYYGLKKYQIQIDIQGATDYAIARMNGNESIIVLCPFNFFSRDMVRFYLWADGDNTIRVYQYPRQPVDTYTPHFNITELIELCKRHNVKYVFTYELGGTVPYFNTTLNLQQIYEQLYASGNFSHISDEATFGANPRRIFVLTFIG
ncbi:MAG: glycosyltransferase family 39 protein [Candidatus Bathyarchaeota archaeon]|nr:glycosyltransferase family 39 protein [Candidatus Bathyarchaeota archaeon]